MAGNKETVLPQCPSAPTTGWQAFLKEKSAELKSSEKRRSSQNALTAFIQKSKRQWSKLSKDEKDNYSSIDTGEHIKSRATCHKRLLKDLNAEIDFTSSTSTYAVIILKIKYNLKSSL